MKLIETDSSRLEEPLVEIILATYNGEKFLAQQLDSIFAQSWTSFRILVNDDGSSDDTLAILASFANRFPGKLFVESNGDKSLGACGNFAALMERTRADYVAFCDQDDIWNQAKLTTSMANLRRSERSNGITIPALVFTDLRLISESGANCFKSHWKRAGVYPEGATFRNLLVQNLVTGCTMVANRKLIELASPIPVKDILMHDYWLALTASAFGVLCPIAEQAVDYRQHEDNVVGVGGGLTLLQRLKRLRRDEELEGWLAAVAVQAAAFLDRFDSVLSDQNKNALRIMMRLHGRSSLHRNIDLLQHGIRRTGVLNNLQFMLRL